MNSLSSASSLLHNGLSYCHVAMHSVLDRCPPLHRLKHFLSLLIAASIVIVAALSSPSATLQGVRSLNLGLVSLAFCDGPPESSRARLFFLFFSFRRFPADHRSLSYFEPSLGLFSLGQSPTFACFPWVSHPDFLCFPLGQSPTFSCFPLGQSPLYLLPARTAAFVSAPSKVM